MANIVRRAVGPNDAGIPEHEIRDVIIPLRLPEGTVFHCHRTGELFDRDGRKLTPHSLGSGERPRFRPAQSQGTSAS